MAKRKNREGTYGEKIIKGYHYKFYRDADGHYTYAKTAKELQLKLKDKKNSVIRVDRGNLTTFGELCTDWLKTMQRELAPGTYDAYENVINGRILKYKLGSLQAKSITLDHFNDYFESLRCKYSKGTIEKTWTVVKQAIRYGIEKDKIPNMDITKIRRPKESEVAVKKKEIQFITLEDMDKLYEESLRKTSRGTCVYGPAANMLVFIMYSGLRIGEAIGLTWKYVDKNFESIRVLKSGGRIVLRDEQMNAVLDEKGQKQYVHHQKETKTESGMRTVPLPERARNVLQELYNVPHKETDHVFLNSKGGVFEKRSVERTLSRMLKNSSCDCKDYTPHSLRHGYGSVLISKGIDIKIVSELLGHSDVAFTYNVYIGVLKEDKIKAVRNVFG